MKPRKRSEAATSERVYNVTGKLVSQMAPYYQYSALVPIRALVKSSALYSEYGVIWDTSQTLGVF